MSFDVRAVACALLASSSLACTPNPNNGERPDAPPGNDAALPADTGPRDTGLGMDAPVADEDAFVALDAPALDAPALDDAPAPLDAGGDAFVAADAGRDAGGPDAFSPRDAGPTWTVGFCRIQYPATAMASADVPTTVYGRVYAAGLTTRSGMTDTDALLVGEVGTGPRGTHPSSVGWTWTGATANTGYGSGSAGYEMNNDEYQGSIRRAAAGVYDYAYRFSGDGGSTWVYCDLLDAGSSDGYQMANAGVLTVM